MSFIKELDRIVELDLVPAAWYTSEYSSLEVYQMWELGKDFKMVNGPYCSVRDITLLREEYQAIYLCNPKTLERLERV